MIDLELDPSTREALTIAGINARDPNLGSLHNLDISVASPMIVGLLSPQPTLPQLLFDVLSGFTPMQSGQVYLDGRRIDELAPYEMAARGLVRTMHQSLTHPALTVSQMLVFAMQSGRLQRPFKKFDDMSIITSKASLEIEQALELAELRVRTGRAVAELSDSERVRLELARCIVQGPRVLIADRLLTDLNTSERHRVKDAFENLRDMEVAILISDSDMVMLSQLCDRVIVLDEGHVIADGRPQEVGSLAAVQQAFTGTELI